MQCKSSTQSYWKISTSWRVFWCECSTLGLDKPCFLKEQATNFLRRLFVGFQDRLGSQKGNTFKIIEEIEPFALPGFKNNPPKGTDFKKPFFDAGKLIFI